ncbi:hypothetical protein AB1Y20_010722 [Prymnesium parvum]|uniref:Uncharacterized protein n=1 Tax=Prymnesium parvum TaxID=97485 RepID=A0AB34IPB4_PRYPA
MLATEQLAQRLASLALAADEIVIIVGDEGAAGFKLEPAVVLSPLCDGEGRLHVRCLHRPHSLLVARRHLLRAAHPRERAALLTRVVWEKQLELRVVRTLLLDSLRGEEGLALQIASHFPPRQTMALTTGFARGRLIPNWSCAVLTDGGLAWRPIHGESAQVYNAEAVSDGIVRIDCAVVDLGAGRFLVAGGCDDHPSRAQRFFSSAFMYDALTHAATPIADMLCIRHGCGGARIGEKVYIVGGEYADSRPTRSFCSVYDLQRDEWSALEADLNASTSINRAITRSRVAFAPVGAVWGRLVVLVEGSPIAFNPQQPAAGWRLCAPSSVTEQLQLGETAMASVEWGEHLIVAAGRGGARPCNVGALSFAYPPTSSASVGLAAAGGVGGRMEQPRCDGAAEEETVPAWSIGRWASLGAVGATSRVGCGLAVVHGRLYVSGGVDETSAEFDGSVKRWQGTLDDLPSAHGASLQGGALLALGREEPIDCTRPWTHVNGLDLPTAMHAHSALTVPMLP